MQKFNQARERDLVSIEKHLEASYLESSSDEDDDTNEDDIQRTVDKVLSMYRGKEADAERTLSYLVNIFQSGGAVCLICISTVKKIDPIWNCGKCFAFMHLSCILRWIRDSLSYKHEKGITPLWGCPKCRTEYSEERIPRVYECFCGKSRDPAYQPWLIPHSCGEPCDKFLEPSCGHKCVLLCHPGPCPPCAQTVRTSCFCGREGPTARRCNARDWCCGKTCDREYGSCSHRCQETCHPGECPPCAVTLTVECRCGLNRIERSCGDGPWTCDVPCARKLSCGVHTCQSKCHRAGDCGPCPSERNRTCPCGKKRYAVSCSEQNLPTCGDTCDKPLDCGSHFCSARCHADKCGQCPVVVTKSCRCGSFSKELACSKEFHCNRKCAQMRLCGRHACNRKCCDCLIKKTANVCERVCDNVLNCRRHKCAAPCHSGPCYPCARTDVVQCRCGGSKITVPCGTSKRVKPPPCNKVCRVPPICHHPKLQTHKCHRGPCPPCKRTCGLVRKRCGHVCSATCHSKVWVKVTVNGWPAAATGPWDKQKDSLRLKTLPCPPCEVSVPVTCLGKHETVPLPCHAARVSSCGRPCGRLLTCQNHTCELPCHKTPGEGEGNENDWCAECERPCTFERPDGCTHVCPKPCHPAPCDPCKQLVKLPCHCGINVVYRRCCELTSASLERRDELLKCGNRCPKNYPCGHRCVEDCHPGECMNAERCNKKVKVWCPCKRIKREFHCVQVRSGEATVACDEVCRKLEAEKKRKAEMALMLQKQAEEVQNRKEVERFERKFKPRRKGNDKFAKQSSNDSNGNGSRRMIFLSALLVTVVGILVIYLTGYSS